MYTLTHVFFTIACGARYTSDGVHGSNVTFFELYQTATDPPFVHVDNATSSDGAHLLSLVHERLLTAHASVALSIH